MTGTISYASLAPIESAKTAEKDETGRKLMAAALDFNGDFERSAKNLHAEDAFPATQKEKVTTRFRELEHWFQKLDIDSLDQDTASSLVEELGLAFFIAGHADYDVDVFEGSAKFGFLQQRARGEEAPAASHNAPRAAM